MDDGNGIPPDQLEAIFERFHRVDPARADTDGSGSGLGLTIARAIVRGHGGTITAASTGLNHGATFTVTLPRTRHLDPRTAGPRRDTDSGSSGDSGVR